MFCNLNRQQIVFSADGRQMTLISGLVAACAIEGLIARSEAAPPAAQPRASSAGAEPAGSRSTADELAKLAKLRASGDLTDEEFAKLKAELIG